MENDKTENSVVSHCYASDWDHRIIDATSMSLGGEVGREDDLNRLMRAIEDGEGEDKLKTACEVAIAFIRLSQDLRLERDKLQKVSDDEEMPCPQCGAESLPANSSSNYCPTCGYEWSIC